MQEQAQRCGGGREFGFTSADFHRISELIYEHAGISLAPNKHEMVYSRLARRVRACKLTRFADYVRMLETEPDPAEWEAFVNSLTTNLTSFFREPHHFAELARFLDRRRGRTEPIAIWCAASSTGEEAYSLAMTAVDAYNSFNIPLTIVATDLDTSVLAHAAAGRYSAERVEKLKPEQLRRFFSKDTDAGAGTVRVRDELRSLVTFRQLNLLDTDWPVRGPFDAIFCRNVMIYFDRPTQRKVLQKLAPLLRSDGLLFAGHSESFSHSSDILRLRGNTIYELAAAQPGAIARPSPQ
jgi:chemotaxis protein methyltransferase CheR